MGLFCDGDIPHGSPTTPASTQRSIEDTLSLEKFTSSLSEIFGTVGTAQYLRTDSVVGMHFTDRIEQNESEEESLNIQENRINIKNITIMSTQQLNYRVWLFGTNDFYHTDPNKTKVVDFIDFDLTSYGKQYNNTGLWIYSITDLNIMYADMNKKSQLHVAIENLSASAKLSYGDSVLSINVMYDRVEK